MPRPVGNRKFALAAGFDRIDDDPRHISEIPDDELLEALDRDHGRGMTPAAIRVRPRERADEPVVERFLAERHSAVVARLGRVERPLDHPALLAERDGELAGVLTYVVEGDECEILTLHAARRWGGAGTALIEAVERLARDLGCRRLWVLTTNDNVDALRFYQRRGFRLAELHAGAVDESRAQLKPEIPETGEYGIPLRDELVLDKRLDAST
jgi:GNAT superfamily N-acetyltransferase